MDGWDGLSTLGRKRLPGTTRRRKDSATELYQHPTAKEDMVVWKCFLSSAHSVEVALIEVRLGLVERGQSSLDGLGAGESRFRAA